jgi:hypothetical protein
MVHVVRVGDDVDLDLAVEGTEEGVAPYGADIIDLDKGAGSVVERLDVHMETGEDLALVPHPAGRETQSRLTQRVGVPALQDGGDGRRSGVRTS